MTKDDRWLSAHNYFRCRHGHAPLSTKASTKANAEKHANKCVFQHSGEPGSGENLAMGYRSPETTTEAWYDEITSPGYSPGQGFSPGIGHYTALIWKETSTLGCATCVSSNIDVCQYQDSQPNIIGQFVQNVPQNNAPVATEATCCASAYAAFL